MKKFNLKNGNVFDREVLRNTEYVIRKKFTYIHDNPMSPIIWMSNIIKYANSAEIIRHANEDQREFLRIFTGSFSVDPVLAVIGAARMLDIDVVDDILSCYPDKAIDVQDEDDTISLDEQVELTQPYLDNIAQVVKDDLRRALFKNDEEFNRTLVGWNDALPSLCSIIDTAELYVVKLHVSMALEATDPREVIRDMVM